MPEKSAGQAEIFNNETEDIQHGTVYLEASKHPENQWNVLTHYSELGRHKAIKNTHRHKWNMNVTTFVYNCPSDGAIY